MPSADIRCEKDAMRYAGRRADHYQGDDLCIDFLLAVFTPEPDKKSLEALLAPYGKTTTVAMNPYGLRKNTPRINSDTPTTINPHPKWSKWCVGGIWDGTLLLKGSKSKAKGVSVARVSDIDFGAMQRRSKFVFCTSDVVTPDGIWHSSRDRGKLGFLLGKSASELLWNSLYYTRFIKPAIRCRWSLVLVNCRI